MTDRDYASKDWLETQDEPLPLPILLMDIGGLLLGAAGIALLAVVALHILA